MEVVIISAQGLEYNNSSALLCTSSRRLRPFIVMTVYPPRPVDDRHVYATRVDDQGGEDPTWGDKFRVPLDASFFANRYSSLILRLYTKRPIFRRAELGCCQIPVADIGYPPQGDVRYMSYRLRARDGTRGQGIVNVSITLTGCPPVPGTSLSLDSDKNFMISSQTAIGIPVKVLS